MNHHSTTSVSVIPHFDEFNPPDYFERNAFVDGETVYRDGVLGVVICFDYDDQAVHVFADERIQIWDAQDCEVY